LLRLFYICVSIHHITDYGRDISVSIDYATGYE
jgi:hypothetical protein